MSNLIPEEMLRSKSPDLPERPELDVIRYFTELSRQSHGIDNGQYPLGSCTMKYNPKRNDALAELDNFRYVHPLQNTQSMQGVLQICHDLQQYLAEITGMDVVTLQPAAGAHGEMTGLLMIKKYFEGQGQKRQIILIPDSAHGTNPASSAMAGFECRIIATNDRGLLDLESLKSQLNEEVAALMITNPSTFGLFEENIQIIEKLLHENGSLIYYDGANLNALMGIVRPGDMGFDVMHVNVHKTFATPHGGGGPGAGPVAAKEFLKEFLPTPVITKTDAGEYVMLGEKECPLSIGSLRGYIGHVSVLIRAYCYILTLGADGLKEASQDAVLNANYLQSKLEKLFPAVFEGRCMHECLLSGHQLPKDISVLELSKRLIDYGIHPPTMIGAGCVYFPGDLGSAMLIETTETESKENLDHLISCLEKIFQEALQDPHKIKSAPHTTLTKKIKA